MSLIRTEPRGLIVDENEIHLSQSFSYQVSQVTTKVMIRMPAVPAEYFQVASFSDWYEGRYRMLRATAAIQNSQYAKELIHFDVMVGSKHNALRAFKAAFEDCMQPRAIGVCLYHLRGSQRNALCFSVFYRYPSCLPVSCFLFLLSAPKTNI